MRLARPFVARESLALIAAAAALSWLLWPVIVRAVNAWSGDEELSFAFLVPPVLAAVLWWRRGELVGAGRRSGSRVGLGLLLLGIVGYALAQRLEARSPAAVMAGVVVWAGCLYLWGWRVARVLAFPLALLTSTLALQQTLISPLAFWLQTVTASNATRLSHLIGLPILQEGLLLRGDNFAFIVADTCSGMNSLLPLLTLAGVLLYVVRSSLVKGAAVVASVLPLVIVANSTRVVCVLLVAAHFGQDTALGFFHGGSSLVLFGLTLVGLLMMFKLVRCPLLVTA